MSKTAFYVRTRHVTNILHPTYFSTSRFTTDFSHTDRNSAPSGPRSSLLTLCGRMNSNKQQEVNTYNSEYNTYQYTVKLVLQGSEQNNNCLFGLAVLILFEMEICDFTIFIPQ